MSVLMLSSPSGGEYNIYAGIGSLVPPFGKEIFTRLTVCSPYDLSICNFGFLCRILVLVMLNPGRCLYFTFLTIYLN